LRKNKIYRPTKGWFLFLSQIIFATVVMAATLYYANSVSNWTVIQLVKSIVIGVLTYGAVLWLLLKFRHQP